MFFIDRMRELEKRGLPFNAVLRSTLPKLFGVDPSDVLRTWVGKKARRDPEYFVRSVSKMFGASARHVLGSLEMLVDERSLRAAKSPREPPVQALLVAIQKAEAGKTAAQPSKLRERP